MSLKQTAEQIRTSLERALELNELYPEAECIPPAYARHVQNAIKSIRRRSAYDSFELGTPNPWSQSEKVTS